MNVQFCQTNKANLIQTQLNWKEEKTGNIRFGLIFSAETDWVSLTRDGGCACAVIEYRQLAEHFPRLHGAQLLPSFSDLHQPLCTHTTHTTTLSLRMRWMRVGEPLILLFSKNASNWWKMTTEKVIKDLYYK